MLFSDETFVALLCCSIVMFGVVVVVATDGCDNFPTFCLYLDHLHALLRSCTATKKKARKQYD